MVGFPQYQMYQQQMPQQNQNNGYVIVRSEEEARNYPLAPGYSMTFFNETQPYCYKKSMSHSPLDHPTFEVYKIVKEEAAPEVNADPGWKAETMALRDELERLREEVFSLKAKQKFVSRKKEDVKDDTE